MDEAERYAPGRRELALALVLTAVGLVARLSQFDLYTAYWADETHQYLEQAFRLLTGHGLIPWEYVDGLRSRFLPLLLAGPMALGHAAGGAEGGILAARLVAALFALAMLPAGWAIGRISSTRHALAALGAMALWFEIVVWSVHVLTETLSITAFLIAAALMMRSKTRRATAVAGAMLALGVIFRFQHGPAAILLAALLLGADWPRWRALALGAVPIVAASSLVDILFGQWPFEWVWQNFAHTIFGGRGAAFGHQPAGWYFTVIASNWRWALPLILVGLIGAPSAYKPLIWTAVANIFVHMAIGHKEYRYIALSQTLFVLVAAIGWVSVMERWWPGERARRWSPAFVVTAIAALSLSLAAREPDEWESIRESTMGRLANQAAKDPQVCAIAFMGSDVWQVTRHVMDRQMPLYLFSKYRFDAPNGPEGPAFNTVIAPSGTPIDGYAQVACNGDGQHRQCLYRRPGGCTVNHAGELHEIQRYRRSKSL
jgi:hypothetical protein